MGLGEGNHRINGRVYHGKSVEDRFAGLKGRIRDDQLLELRRLMDLAYKLGAHNWEIGVIDAFEHELVSRALNAKLTPRTTLRELTKNASGLARPFVLEKLF